MPRYLIPLFLFIPLLSLKGEVVTKISGQVLLEGASRGIKDLMITATPVRVTSEAPPMAVKTGSAADGTFELNLDKSGTFRLCAQLPDSNYVNDCLWGYRNVIVEANSATPKIEGLVLWVRRGVPVELRVDDPNNKLRELKKSSNAGVYLNLFAPGHMFHPFWLQGESGNGRDYRIVVPLDTDVKISVRSEVLTLRDNNGRALGHSERIPFRRNAGDGDAPHKIKLKVD